MSSSDRRFHLPSDVVRRIAGVGMVPSLALVFSACVAASGSGVGADEDDGGGDTGATFDSGIGPSDIGGREDATGDAGQDGDAAEIIEEPDPICGNGVVEGDEVCDDRNNFPGDGCSALCNSTEVCGNELVDFGEACDDGGFDPGDGCDAFCRLESGCGNEVLDRGEQCDDGNISANDGCSPTCQREVLLASDVDSDTIADFDEEAGRRDTDGDGLVDSEDADSDNDGIPDIDEAGDFELATPPIDTDDDGTPDFQDLDSDNDGIADEDEGVVDTDGDGLGNWRDPDSDGDYLPDEVDGIGDNDGDGTLDYLDRDSDNDGILDEHELFADSDGDGSPNRYDLDSDADTLTDTAEAGDAEPNTYPVDTDADGLPDYIDTDSDDDGLGDQFETGCGSSSSDPRQADTDADGYSDLAEFLVGANPCIFNSRESFREFTDFFFVLPEDGPEQTEPLQFSSNIVKADVAINMDTTGSMGGEINTLRSSLSAQIVPTIRTEISDTGFAVSDFRDFPCGDYGAGGDYPFRLSQRVTTSLSAAQTAVNNLGLGNGNDYFESGFESLYQIASGAGRTGCNANVPAFNPAAGLVPGVADGTLGGVGFRSGAFPIVIHVTDAPSHDGPGASAATAISALQGRQARAISVVSGSDPRGQLENVAVETGAQVRACAWDGARPDGCGASQCCTGINGNGRGTNGAGMCPLVFDVDSNGGGLGAAITTAVRALVNTTTLQVTTVLRPEPSDPIDGRCFIQGIVPNRAEVSGGCTTSPTAVDINPVDGVNDSWSGVTPGTALFFDVLAQNDGCVDEILGVPQAFTVYIDVVGDGLTVLDTQTVTIIVPAGEFNPTTVP
jgi:cysteine-rich repeat protein